MAKCFCDAIWTMERARQAGYIMDDILCDLRHGAEDHKPGAGTTNLASSSPPLHKAFMYCFVTEASQPALTVPPPVRPRPRKRSMPRKLPAARAGRRGAASGSPAPAKVQRTKAI